jgi:hypothetical protein
MTNGVFQTESLPTILAYPSLWYTSFIIPGTFVKGRSHVIEKNFLCCGSAVTGSGPGHFEYQLFETIFPSGQSPIRSHRHSNLFHRPQFKRALDRSFFLNASIVGVNTGGFVSTFIVDNLGNPVTTAAVTLTTPNGSFPVTFVGVNSSNPPANMGIVNITGGQYTNAVTYTSGQLCSVTVVIGGTTYSSNFTASNAAGNVASGAGGVTCTWTIGGNENLVYVAGADFFQDGPSPAISSPYVIPAASFVNDPAGHGNDVVILLLMQEIEPAFSGCNASSVIGTGIETGLYY